MLCKPDKLRYCIDTLLTITNLPCPCMCLAKLKIPTHFRTTILRRMFGCVSDFPGFELTLLNKRLRLEISLVCIWFLRATITLICELSWLNFILVWGIGTILWNGMSFLFFNSYKQYSQNWNLTDEELYWLRIYLIQTPFFSLLGLLPVHQCLEMGLEESTSVLQNKHTVNLFTLKVSIL